MSPLSFPEPNYKPPDANTAAQLMARANGLWRAFQISIRNAEAVTAANSLFVYVELYSVSKDRSRLETDQKKLFEDIQNQLSVYRIIIPASQLSTGIAYAPYLQEMVTSVQESGRFILTMQRLQEASASLTAVVERKYAYAFGYISLYFALLSVLIGILSILPK